MRKFIGYLFFGLWMLPMLLVAAATDATTWAAKTWRRWRLCALLVIGYTGCSAQQQPTLLAPAGNGLNELEYVGTADTLWGFAVVLIAFDPERIAATPTNGGVVYGLQPYPAYALRWQKGFRDAEFYYRTGVRIPSEEVFLFKITTIPKD